MFRRIQQIVTCDGHGFKRNMPKKNYKTLLAMVTNGDNPLEVHEFADI